MFQIPLLSETSRCLPLRTPALAVLECDREDAVETCSLQCESNSHFSTSGEGTYTYRCGQSTQYVWTPEMRNDTLPSCSGRNSYDDETSVITYKYICIFVMILL